MSYEEKGVWSFLFVVIVGYGVYLWLVLPQLVAGTPVDEVDYAAPMLWTIGGAIVAGILARIAVEIITPSESTKADVRDKQIERAGVAQLLGRSEHEAVAGGDRSAVEAHDAPVVGLPPRDAVGHSQRLDRVRHRDHRVVGERQEAVTRRAHRVGVRWRRRATRLVGLHGKTRNPRLGVAVQYRTG